MYYDFPSFCESITTARYLKCFGNHLLFFLLEISTVEFLSIKGMLATSKKYYNRGKQSYSKLIGYTTDELSTQCSSYLEYIFFLRIFSYAYF